MGKNVGLLLVFFFLTAPFVIAAKPVSAVPPVENSWTSKAPMQQARGGLGVAVVNGKVYAIGGMNASSRPPVNTNEKYDPSADTWVFKAPMPTARTSFGIAVYQNKVYCVGGKAYEDSFLVTGANEVYDPAADKWETLTSMPAPRYGIEAGVVDGKIYVVGGESNTTDVYDPQTDSWTTQAPLPVTPYLYSGWSCASTVVDGKIYVIGLGYNNSGSIAFQELYDPESDSWLSLGAKLPLGYFAVAGMTTGVLAPKRIYVLSVDSESWSLQLPEFEVQSFDLVTGNRTMCASIPTGRVNAGVVVVDDVLYVLGGWVPSLGSNVHASSVNEMYVPFGYGTVPEFPSVIILPLLIIGTLLALVYFKKRKR